MKKKDTINLGKEVYKELRTQSWEELWGKEVPLFDQGDPAYRLARVGLVRAIGVVALGRTTQEQKLQTRQWLAGLLQDPQEKIRRYAVLALPKLGDSKESEKALLSMLDEATESREVDYLSRTLDKIGGQATLNKLESLEGRGETLNQTEQKIRAQLARNHQSSGILLNAKIRDFRGLRIHLRTRRGMESFLCDELLAHPILKNRFKVLRVSPACVAISAISSFTIKDLHQLRTFGSINFVLGVVEKDKSEDASAFARVITSKQCQRLCKKLTEGKPRYRLEFIGVKVAAKKLQAIINEAFALCPELLNDARKAPWLVEVHSEKIGYSIELRPRILPDPRFTYRVDDVPASTHPPLAAAMARLAGVEANDVVWDPFCGSGQELIERAMLGEVKRLVASDIDEKAIKAVRSNFSTSESFCNSTFIHCCDFREYARVTKIFPESVSLILSNPPLGRRIRVPNLSDLIADFYKTAAEVLCPGGRLVFINPLKLESPVPSLKLEQRHLVDLGGFSCRVEKWIKM